MRQSPPRGAQSPVGLQSLLPICSTSELSVNYVDINCHKLTCKAIMKSEEENIFIHFSLFFFLFSFLLSFLFSFNFYSNFSSFIFSCLFLFPLLFILGLWSISLAVLHWLVRNLIINYMSTKY